MAGNSSPLVGILALQGDFDKHREKLLSVGANTVLVKNPVQLNSIQALVVPGGESSVLLKLLNKDLTQAIIDKVQAGLPVLTTCAGTILFARKVLAPSQESLGLVNIKVQRNAYGSQKESMVVAALAATEVGKPLFPKGIEGVFIRAPKIVSYGAGVEVLLVHKGDPVLVREGNIYSATFHPELSDSDSSLHSLILGLV